MDRSSRYQRNMFHNSFCCFKLKTKIHNTASALFISDNIFDEVSNHPPPTDIEIFFYCFLKMVFM